MPKFKVKVVKKTFSTKEIIVEGKNVDEAIANAFSEATKSDNAGFTQFRKPEYILGWIEDENLGKKKKKRKV